MKMKTSCVHFIILLIGYSSAMTDEEVMMQMAKHLMACAKDNPAVDVSDLLKLQQLEVPTKTDVKCVLACAYRKLGTLRDDGMFDKDAGDKYAEKVQEGNEKRLANAKKLNDICIKVNDEKVGDGEKGCDRAALMFKCLTTQAPKLGFKTKFDASKLGDVIKNM